MPVDGVAGSALELVHEWREAQVLEIDASTAARTDEMMMVSARIAADVSMVAIRKVQSLDEAGLVEELKSSEDRGAARAEMPTAGIRHEVCAPEGTRL